MSWGGRKSESVAQVTELGTNTARTGVTCAPVKCDPQPVKDAAQEPDPTQIHGWYMSRSDCRHGIVVSDRQEESINYIDQLQ